MVQNTRLLRVHMLLILGLARRKHVQLGSRADVGFTAA